MRYCAVDTETTGTNPERHALMEIAFVLEDTKNQIPINDLPFFRCYVKHSAGAFWDPFCLEMHKDTPLWKAQQMELWDHGDDREHAIRATADNGAPIFAPAEANASAQKWLQRHGITPAKQVTPAGKNFGSFDRLFLPHELRAFFNRRVLDPGSVFVDWSADELPNMQKLLGYEPAHDALEDARDVVRVLRRAYAV